jgi:hypothetical protein
MALRRLRAVVFIQNHVSSLSPENQSLGLVEGCLLRAIAKRTAGSFSAAWIAAYAVRKLPRTNSMPLGPKARLAMLCSVGRILIRT